jgi:hypothetical protein
MSDLNYYMNIEKSYERKFSKPRNVQSVSKLLKKGSYIDPMMEDNVVGFMKNNKDVGYEKLIDMFKISRRRLEQLRKINNIGHIKKQNVKTSQYILKQQNKRRCPSCKQIKCLSTEWYENVGSRCISCDKIRSKEKFKKRQIKELSSLDNFLESKIRESFQRKYLKNELTLDLLLEIYNKQNGKCFYTGEYLQLARRNNSAYSLSIDRIDSNKGYVRDNIVLCSSIANFMKQNYNIKDFLKACKQIADNFKDAE